MNKHKYIYLVTALSALLLISACGNGNNSGAADAVNTVPAETSQENATAPAPTAPAATASPEDTNTAQPNTAAAEVPGNADPEILIIIDQTPKPIEGNSFDFAVNKRPEGYALAEMQWISKENLIVNSVQDAIAHGGNGEDGFYISGNGQFMGFFYPDALKGEEGQVVFIFKNEAGKELTWKKTITLN